MFEATYMHGKKVWSKTAFREEVYTKYRNDYFLLLFEINSWTEIVELIRMFGKTRPCTFYFFYNENGKGILLKRLILFKKNLLFPGMNFVMLYRNKLENKIGQSLLIYWHANSHFWTCFMLVLQSKSTIYIQKTSEIHYTHISHW